MSTIEIQTRLGSIIIREAATDDASKFRDLRLYALRESPAAFPADYEETAKQSPDFWQERLKNGGNAVLFFAEHDDQLVGMTGIRRGESPKTRHSAHIWGVYVRPEWRGLHIAESLIEACTEWVRSKGVNTLHPWCHVSKHIRNSLPAMWFHN